MFNIVIKFLNLNEMLPAAALGLNICCAWFLARSFLTIGLPILRELGAGALSEKSLTLFGVRWKIVETAIKQKAEVSYGLSLLVFAALCGFLSLFMSLKPHNWIFSLVIVIAIFVLFWGIGKIMVPLLNYYFFVKAAKKSLHKSPEYWLGLKTEQRNDKIMKQVKCYHLGKFYEKFTTKKLQKYLEKLGNMKNGKSDKRYIDKYGMKKET